MCSVAPKHVPMLKGFGTLLLIMALGSLVLKKTYFKGVIDKAQAPSVYWASVGCYLFLGVFVWGGLLVC